jgi:hypothetical protein
VVPALVVAEVLRPPGRLAVVLPPVEQETFDELPSGSPGGGGDDDLPAEQHSADHGGVLAREQHQVLAHAARVGPAHDIAHGVADGDEVPGDLVSHRHRGDDDRTVPLAAGNAEGAPVAGRGREDALEPGRARLAAGPGDDPVGVGRAGRGEDLEPAVQHGDRGVRVRGEEPENRCELGLLRGGSGEVAAHRHEPAQADQLVGAVDVPHSVRGPTSGGEPAGGRFGGRHVRTLRPAPGGRQRTPSRSGWSCATPQTDRGPR